MQNKLNNIVKDLQIIIEYPENRTEICPMPKTHILYKGKEVGLIKNTDVDDWQLINIDKEVFDVNVWLDDSVLLGQWKSAVYEHEYSTYAEIKNIKVINGDI